MSQQQCLPVQRKRKNHGQVVQKSDSFSDIGSMDANEYLLMVQAQAGQLPDVFVSQTEISAGDGQFDDGDEEREQSEILMEEKSDSKRYRANTNNENSCSFSVSGSAAAASYLVSSCTELLPPPQHLDRNGKNPYVPTSPIWADRALDAFSRLRLYLEHVETENMERKIPLPPLKDRAGWHVFCVGKQEAEGNKGGYYGEDDHVNSDVAEDRANADCMDAELVSNNNGSELKPPAWKEALQQKEGGHFLPTTSLLLQMDQVMVRRVLNHLTYFVCEGWDVTETRAAWLYGLAARLDRSVHRDDAVVLYQLLKRLTVLRASNTESQGDSDDNDNKVLARLNTLILIFGVYFEQGGGYATLMEPAGEK